MIRLIVTDVDGTLLDNNSKITELNKQAIGKCIKNGIGVILATGKSVAAVVPIIKKLGLNLPQITLGGAIILDRDLNILNAIKIEPGLYYKVIKAIKEKGYKPLVALTNGVILYDEYDPDFIVFEKINEPIFKVDRLENDQYANDCANMSIPITEKDPLDGFLRKKFSSKLQFVRSGEYYFDVLNLDATKGNALRIVCSKLGIKKNEVAVFGDSPNDLSMFDFASMKIAVKNSYPEVLEAADYITDENYNSGLAKAIYKYILAKNI